MNRKKWFPFKKMVLAVFTVALTCAVSASALTAGTPPGEATERSYYLQYQKIVEAVSRETGCDIGLLPIEQFADEDWKTPKEFREFVTAAACWDMVCAEQVPSPYATTSPGVSQQVCKWNNAPTKWSY